MPKGKGSATKTARMMEAWADDLRTAADGFDEAAKLYREGDSLLAFGAALGSAAYADMVVHSTRSKKV